MEPIKVGVIGATGKMGLETCKAILEANDMNLVCAIGRRSLGSDIGILTIGQSCGVAIENNLEKSLAESNPDVVVDLTNIMALRENAPVVLNKGIPMVVGTTGLSEKDREAFANLAEKNHTTFFLVANFAIGAVLMMRFAEIAAKYMPHVEIVEMHHEQKKDAPSGTALKTLEKIQSSRKDVVPSKVDELEILKGCRGGERDGIHIHSLRLPGYNAHQEVIFGDVGQTLHIRHDSIHRNSFMPGVLLAIRRVRDYRGFIEDLDTVME